MVFAANAQTITDELRQKKDGQGTVVVNQSTEIERLVNGPVTTSGSSAGGVITTAVSGSAVADKASNTAATPSAASPSAANKTTATTPATAGKTNTPSATHSPSASAETAEAEAPAVNMNKKIMRHSYKTTGYRIQVYSGGNKREDRAKCDQIAQRVKTRFPELPIYVHFYSPSWKCRVGNFTNLNEAQSVLAQIKGMGYTQACLVKGTISVQY